MFYPERAAELGFSVLEACVIARLTAFTNFGAKPCFYSNSNLMKDFNVSLASAKRTISYLEKEKVISSDFLAPKNSKVKQRVVKLNLKHKIFSNQAQNDHGQNDTGVKMSPNRYQNEPDHGQNDTDTGVKMSPLNRSINSIDKEDRSLSLKKENIKEKTETAEQQENTDSMFLPQDLLPEGLKQPELTVINSVNPLNCDADPQNIAINTLDGTNTHPQALTPVKTKSERSESVSKKPTRNRKVKNPEFDEQGNKIFYVKDNPPTLEQTVSCMQNIADKFFNNLLIDRKAVQEDIAFLDSLNLRSEAERCFEHYQSNGWVINTGDYLKNWYMTCRRWISKKIDQSWSQWERDKRFKRRSYTNNGTNQRTYGETLNDFQGRVIDQINRIGQGMFDNQTPELEYGQHNLLNNGGNQRK